MSVDAKAVKALRDKTGAGMMECKAALTEGEGNPVKAEEILKKRGLLRASKFAARETKSGRIGSYVHHNGRIAATVEVLCETDFVADCEDFKQLVADLCKQIVGANPAHVSREELPPEKVAAERERFEAEAKGKPPEVAAKMVEGKLAKQVYSQFCLLDQPFIDADKFSGSVADRIKQVMAKVGENISVRRFARFELGA